jgi:hypothetical protein
VWCDYTGRNSLPQSRGGWQAVVPLAPRRKKRKKQPRTAHTPTAHILDYQDRAVAAPVQPASTILGLAGRAGAQTSRTPPATGRESRTHCGHGLDFKRPDAALSRGRAGCRPALAVRLC